MIGRFAPSPTGPLHFGSLVAALASWLAARAAGGRWLLRIEDIDPDRELPGAAQQIPKQLAHLGLHWDGDICWQSQRTVQYRDVAHQLLTSGSAFRCQCSRKTLSAQPHSGRCRVGTGPAAIRLACDQATGFDDALQGNVPSAQIGDFVIWRKEDLPAYHLAVVVDDAEQGITDIVRGADLLSASLPQRMLQQQLALPSPRYAHIPVVLGADGQKLSKQNLAPALRPENASVDLQQALRFLGQGEIELDQPARMLQQALAQWDWMAIPRQHGLALDAGAPDSCQSNGGTASPRCW